ncbi:hypothetical protein [Sphaerochaeta sp.]|uniref:hypothetical protein n=1 Tax=Sphaerochaeta sp. TaxID=1972642 RepID=UPI002FCA494D
MENLLYKNMLIDRKKENIIYLLLTLSVTTLYMIIMFNRNFPVAEGWYSYYSELINQGQKPYQDFEYLFFPFYINFIALFTRIFGYNIIALRILGIGIFILISTFAYLSFSKVFSPQIGMISTLITVFYLQSEIVQIFYDYVRLMDLSAYISIFLLVCTVTELHKKSPKKAHLYSIFNGIIVSIFILIKQNTGILFWLYVIGLYIYLLLAFNAKKSIYYSMLLFVFSSVLCLFLSLVILVGIPNIDNFLNLTVRGAATAKGGIKTVLFEWLKTGNRFSFKGAILLLFFPFSFYISNYIADSHEREKYKRFPGFVYGLIFFLIAFLGIVFIFLNPKYAYFLEKQSRIHPWLIYYCILFGLAVGAGRILFFLFKRIDIPLQTHQILVLGGGVFALGYGCGTSGGLAEGQLAFGFGLIIAFVLFHTRHNFQLISYTLISIFCIYVILVSSSFKMVNSYNWWGLQEPDIWSATEKTKIPKLSGIYVSRNTNKVLNTVYDLVQKYTDLEDPIFCFPQIPIFYTLLDRKDPGTFTKVQWFDVSTDINVVKDMAIIEKVMPKVIIIQNVPEWVRSKHESMFRDSAKSGLSIMNDLLYSFCRNNDYKEMDKLEINGDNTLTIFIKMESTND